MTLHHVALRAAIAEGLMLPKQTCIVITFGEFQHTNIAVSFTPATSAHTY